MAHFAQIVDGVVVNVLKIEQDQIDTGLFGDPSTWIQTSYNTKAGIYYNPNTGQPDPDQSKAFRKNYACIGFSWDAGRNAFIPPKPQDGTWVLDEFSCTWVQP